MPDEYTIWERIVDKLLSGRFVATVMICGTLCAAVLQAFRIVGLESGDKELLMFRKEIFLYVMGVFSGIVGSVMANYFSRTDRNGGKKEPKELNKP